MQKLYAVVTIISGNFENSLNTFLFVDEKQADLHIEEFVSSYCGDDMEYFEEVWEEFQEGNMYYETTEEYIQVIKSECVVDETEVE